MKKTLLIKVSTITAVSVIVNSLYYSAGIPREECDEIWVINKIDEGRANLIGRYKGTDISPIAPDYSIPTVFAQSQNHVNWKFIWKLKDFINKNGNVIAPNLSEYNNVSIDLRELHAHRAIHTQTIGYLDLIESDIKILDIKYGIKFPIAAVAKPATKPVKQPVTKPVKQPVKLKPNVIVGYSLSSAQHIASITPTRDGSDFHITFRESPGKKYSAKHLGLTV